MRSALLVCICILFLFSCGDDKSTNPNNQPVITALNATPNPVALNRTCALSVTVSDPDAGDGLTYAWTATAGVFATGNSTANVVWVPPTIQTVYTISVHVSDGKANDDSVITINVIRPVYNLTGHLLNQNGEAADNVTMNITDAEDSVWSTTSSDNGSYSIPDLPAGPVTIEMSGSEIVADTLGRYLDKDTTVDLTQDDIIDMQVREFHQLLYDDGNDTSLWVFSGDVQNDGTKYIIGQSSASDNITMRNNFHIPDNAAIQHTGILIQAQTSPSGSSSLRRIIYAGNDSWFTDTSIGPNQAWYYMGLSDIPNLAGIIGKVRFEYSDPSRYMFIYQVYVYNY